MPKISLRSITEYKPTVFIPLGITWGLLGAGKELKTNPVTLENLKRAAMTDDSQPDVQPPLEWWSYDALAQSDSQPAEAYVWTAPIGPTPEQAKEAEQDRLWRLVVGTARGG